MSEEKNNKFSSKFTKKSDDNSGSGFSDKFKNSKSLDIKKMSSIESTKSVAESISNIAKDKKDDNHIKKLQKSRKDCLYLVRGKDMTVKCEMCNKYGEDCRNHGHVCSTEAWHYVLVDLNKKLLFESKVKSGSVNVIDFGVVIESGWGRDPSEEDVKKVNEKFE